MNFLLFILGGIGLTNLIVDKLPKKWLHSKLNSFLFSILTCHQCAGMWVGMGLGAMLIDWHPQIVFAAGCTTSILSTFYANLTEYIQSLSILDMEDYDDEEF